MPDLTVGEGCRVQIASLHLGYLASSLLFPSLKCRIALLRCFQESSQSATCQQMMRDMLKKPRIATLS